MSNWKVKALSIILGLSLLVPTVSFAADTIAKKELPGKKGVACFERGTEPGMVNQDKVLELVTKYTPEDLGEWESALAERQQLMSGLRERAPVRPERPQLTEEEKEKMEALREKVKNGEMTHEELRAELGFPAPDKNLAERTRPELTAEELEKMKALRGDFENAREQVRKDFRKPDIQKDFAGPNNLRFEFNKAVEEGDEPAIKELLPQLLEQLKEGNQKLSAKLSEEE